MPRYNRNKSRSKRNKSRSNKTTTTNIVKRTMNKSVGSIKDVGKTYIPKVKSGLKFVGYKVVNTGKTTIPILKRTARKIFSMFGTKTKKHKKH